jgi:putative phage-type endonuclease
VTAVATEASRAYPTGATVVLAADAPEAEWLAMRTTGIGGSDIAAICGLNPYTSPLEIYLTKAGTPTPRKDNQALSEAAEMGHELEPVVARRFAKNTGLPVFDNPGTLRRPDLPWALVNLDRFTEEDGLPGVVELKTRSSYALRDWQDETPVDTQVQVQWQLAVTGWSFGYAACLIGGQRTIVHRIERDDQMIGDLLAIGGEFWQWIQDRTPPPIDGSAATGELLDRIHAKANADQIVVGDAAEVEKWLSIRATAKEQIAAADIALTEAENHLKHMCGDATEVHIRGEKAYSWPQYSRRGGIDFAGLLEDHPDLNLDDYRKPSTTYRTLRVHLENL